MLSDLLPLLRCPECGDEVIVTSNTAATITCPGCRLEAPIVDGIPRFVTVPDEPAAQRTQASFGYEWNHFDDWQPSGATNFQDYFRGVDLDGMSQCVVLDAGCGMGRHARQIARHVAHVVAVDFSRAIDAAKRNVCDLPNVDCVQGDLLALPLATGAFDFVYSLGVLHHLEDTEGALSHLIRRLKPGGRLRVYLYWRRDGWSGAVLDLVSLVRRVTVRMPFPLLRGCCLALSAGLWLGIVGPYKALRRFGVPIGDRWPLATYARYPFAVLYNDQFDRFSAPVEKRYGRDEVRALLERAGLSNVSVEPCFGWIGEGIRPS